MRNILILTDFSEASRNALKYALSWLQDIKMPCHVLLLNTYLIPPAATDQLVHINDELRSHSLKKLQDEMRSAKNMVKDGLIDFEIVSYMGTLKNIIGHLTTEKNIHCLIAGSDNAFDTRSLQEAHCPVFIVSPHQSYDGSVQPLAERH